jgi:hypothetical protein
MRYQFHVDLPILTYCYVDTVLKCQGGKVVSQFSVQFSSVITEKRKGKGRGVAQEQLHCSEITNGQVFERKCYR